jgi:predicted nucleic acid-binding protein
VPRRPKVHLVDTNVVIRFLIGDAPDQAAKATALMRRLESGGEVAELTEAVVAETVWTLESFYEVPRAEIAEKLGTILGFRGVRAWKKPILLAALARFGSTSVDFVDCLLAAHADRRGLPVYSFDATDFRRLGVAWEAPG